MIHVHPARALGWALRPRLLLPCLRSIVSVQQHSFLRSSPGPLVHSSVLLGDRVAVDITSRAYGAGYELFSTLRTGVCA